ncbi:MAG: N-acetyl sugar amidotransferase [Dehalococcoidia bacterium]
MNYCTKCVMPDTRPDLRFDDQGVCDACRSAERKHGINEAINWDERRHEFEDLIQRHRPNDPLKYDCVIPVSGGKDSHLTLYYAKVVHGLNPLCIVFEPTLPTDIGRQNLENIHRLGVDLVHFKRNPIVYEKMILEGFKRVGDMEWANHMGIWTVPVHFAIKFDIPLILWGESPQQEYGGAETVSEVNKRIFNEDWLNDYGCLNGLRPQDLVGDDTGLTLSDMKMYVYPSKEEVAKWGGMGVFMGYYFKWNVPENFDLIESIGWRRRRGRIEISYTDYEKLDCLSMNLHDYLKYVKYGYGRATDAACMDIRNGVISREEGVRLVEKYDSIYPKGAVEEFCEHFRMDRAEFDALSDGFTNKALFERASGRFVRDVDGSLVMKQKYIDMRRNPRPATGASGEWQYSGASVRSDG